MRKRLFSKNGQAYLFIVLLRLGAPLLIFKHTFLSLGLTWILDVVDIEFASRSVLTRTEYELFDKWLDLWWYLTALVFAYMAMPEHFWFLLPFFIYRGVGQLIFLATKNEKVLALFPALFGPFFYLFFFSKVIPSLSFLVQGEVLYVCLGFLAILKIMQEITVHVILLSLPKVLWHKKRAWAKR